MSIADLACGFSKDVLPEASLDPDRLLCHRPEPVLPPGDEDEDEDDDDGDRGSGGGNIDPEDDENGFDDDDDGDDETLWTRK